MLFEQDDVIRDAQDAGQAIWVAHLADGRTVYQDDLRSNWRALREAAHRGEVSVRWVGLKFRDRQLQPFLLDELGSVHFFSQALRSELFGGEPQHLMLVGTGERHGNVARLVVRTYKVPELTLVDTSVREVPVTDGRLIQTVGASQEVLLGA